MTCLSTPSSSEDMLRSSSSSRIVGRNPKEDAGLDAVDVIEGSSGEGHEAEDDDAVSLVVQKD